MAPKFSTKQKTLINEYFDVQSKQSIWQQICDMVDSHIVFQTIISARKYEKDVDTVICNRQLMKTLNSGYVSSQALFIRCLTQKSTTRNSSLSIPGFLNQAKTSFPASILKLLPDESIFDNDKDIKNIRAFSDQYIAHIDKKRKTNLNSLDSYTETLERCHSNIIKTAINIYANLTNTHFCPVTRYRNLNLHGSFCSDETANNAYKLHRTLTDKYLRIGTVDDL